MFNLLPESLKQEIITDYKLRRFIIALVFLIFIEISFMIFMLPSFIISHSKEKELELRVQVIDKSSEALNINSIKTTIRSLNNDLNIIDRMSAYLEPVLLIDTVLSKKTNSIRITDISYTSVSTSTANLAIQGISSTRDTLVEFKKNLDESGFFKNIDLPISNLAKDRNINFSMTMTGNVKI